MTLADIAISKMRPPSQMKIICIDITNRCNLSCSNCTRLLENQVGYWDMSLDNFRKAVSSLSDFPGMIAIIGGNPCMHREFEAICQILVEEIPDINHRGLWSNNVFKHTELVVNTFGGFNLNAHGDTRGKASLADVSKRVGDKAYLYQGNSKHAPLLAAIKDIYGEEKMWDLISKCDINQNWSATIIENQGNLRAYFCEVAGSFDVARKGDFGIEVRPNWWRASIESFSDQIKHFCPGCGAAASIKGVKDNLEIDTFTKSNIDLVAISRDVNKRETTELDVSSVDVSTKRITHYANYDFTLIRRIRHIVRLRTRVRKFFRR